MLKPLINENRRSLGLTALLLLIEALLALLFPLAIGIAIDGAINENHGGIFKLGLLGFATLLIGAFRRMYDTRVYARIFQEISPGILSRVKDPDPSRKSARLGMIRELVEFLENSLPELMNATIGLAGVLVILATLNQTVFQASLVVAVLIMLIYWKSSNKTVRLNKEQNDELEKQVGILSENNEPILRAHLQKMMKWNIKLSDLEVVNFSFSWLVLLVFLAGTIHISIQSGVTQYGLIFSLVMYVFQFIESLISLPLYYQGWLRLKEIIMRMES